MKPKIKLTIAGKPVELTIDEAKALHAELAAIFGPVVINHPVSVPMPYPVPVPVHDPTPWWPGPTFIEPVRPTWTGDPVVTCLANGRAA